jgi:hypothetical protein
VVICAKNVSAKRDIGYLKKAKFNAYFKPVKKVAKNEKCYVKWSFGLLFLCC